MANSPLAGGRLVGHSYRACYNLFRVRRETGWSWAIVTSAGFWLELVSSLLITGVLGGVAFEWTMTKAGFPPSPGFTRDDHDPTA